MQGQAGRMLLLTSPLPVSITLSTDSTKPYLPLQVPSTCSRQEAIHVDVP